MREGEAAIDRSSFEDDLVAPGAIRGFMSPADKHAFLTSKNTVRAIRRVAWSRAVPSQEVDDVVQQTCAQAWKGRLPADPAEARRVVNRIAFTVSCRHMGGHAKQLPRRDEEPRADIERVARAVDASPDPDLAVQVQRLLDKARAKFPNRLDGFLASVTSHAPATEEARRRGVTGSHVRKERSQIRQFLQLHGRKMGLLTAAALVVLVFGAMRDWTRKPYMTGPDDWSDRSPTRRETPTSASDTRSLRERAADACRDLQWDECIADLDAARAIDGQPDTPEEARMRIDASNARKNDPRHSRLK